MYEEYKVIENELRDKPMEDLQRVLYNLASKVERRDKITHAGLAFCLGSLIGTAVCNAFPELRESSQAAINYLTLPSIFLSSIYVVKDYYLGNGFEDKFRVDIARRLIEERQKKDPRSVLRLVA